MGKSVPRDFEKQVIEALRTTALLADPQDTLHVILFI